MTLSPRAFGPDVTSSLTIGDLARLVEGTRWLECAAKNPGDKTTVDTDRERMRSVFGQSLVAARDLAVGEELSREVVVCRKPGTGIPVSHFERYLGCKMVRAVSAGQFLEEADLASVT